MSRMWKKGDQMYVTAGTYQGSTVTISCIGLQGYVWHCLLGDGTEATIATGHLRLLAFDPRQTEPVDGDPVKFQLEPGQEVIYSYPGHQGPQRRVWLVTPEDLSHGRIWYYAIKEDGPAYGSNYERFFSPVPAPEAEMAGATGPVQESKCEKWAYETCPGVTPDDKSAWCRTCLLADMAELMAKTKAGHVVESIDPTPIPSTVSSAPSAPEGWQSAMKRAFDPAPSVQTVLEGAARWQQADPSRRRVNIQLQGHSVLVWVTVLDPEILKAHAQFFTPESAETTHDILDHAAKLAAKFNNLEYVNARNPRQGFPLEPGGTDL